ncbi:MAG: hypothetical protein Q4D76_20390 [Oscillospiraceae bacterium]|nr:hypothetical protein [Oscillospiraceae bacterium]
MKFAIVAVGYNRPESMKTLLGSLVQAEYENDPVDLIISIDRGEKQKEIVFIAEQTDWKHGEKIIRAFSERQGLRKHILQCGDLSEKYDAVVVLEDDLLVSEYFYSYTKQAVEFYKNDEHIAGISLYKHVFHPGVCRPFEPDHNGYDAFMMQFAQSWGQCWTKKMWIGFKEWYVLHENSDLSEGSLLPSYIANWNSHSWLKYFMRYIVETDKYFVYPMISLSTNASDAGQHCQIPNNDYQVPLLNGSMEFRLPRFEDAVKYDVFFERIGLEDIIFRKYKGKKVLDLYGNREFYGDADYVVSTRELPYKKVEHIGLIYRPIEQNCISPQRGEGMYLYDVHQKCRASKVNTNLITRYDIKGLHWKKLIRIGLEGVKTAVRTRAGRN